MENRSLQATIEKFSVLVIGMVLSAALTFGQAAAPKAASATPTKVEAPVAAPKTGPVNPNLVLIKEADIQYEIPAGWRTEPHQDALQITSPDGGVSIIIGLAVNDNTEAMIAGLKEYLKKDYQNFKAGSDLQKETINDLRALIENGSGETSEGLMEWNIVVLIGGKRPVFAFTVAEQKAFRNSQGDYIKLVQSIKKVDGRQ
jgi:predicted Zn-dependent protease